MSLINVAELLSDPDFVQNLSGTRKTVQIATTGDAAGEAITTTNPFNFVGAAMPLKGQKDIDLLPEGYRNLEGVVVYTMTPLYAAAEPDGAAIVDVVEWHGKSYTLVLAESWAEYGYYKGIGVVLP